MPDWNAIAEKISTATGTSREISSTRPLGGGCINQAFLLQCSDGSSFFAKLNGADFLPHYQNEAFALEKLAAANAVRVPNPITSGIAGKQAFLILEYLEMASPQSDSQRTLGRQLAALHQSTAPKFGWDHDNVIGSTPQYNQWEDSWITFFARHRLEPQIEWAKNSGLNLPGADDLIRNLNMFFQDYSPVPSLLHGDLWGGNVAYLENGQPVLFDPASYYGDRETDLAFTEMFGGFGSAFYDAYHQAWPIHDGFSRRKHLYNLYHVLNHFNLFGGGYGSQAASMVKNLLNSAK